MSRESPDSELRAAKGQTANEMDMTPATSTSVLLQQHSVLAATHAHALRSLKEETNHNHNSNDDCGDAVANQRMHSNNSPTNLSTSSSATATAAGNASPPATAIGGRYRCQHCNDYETTMHQALLVHTVQCLSNRERLKSENYSDGENLSRNGRSSPNASGTIGAALASSVSSPLTVGGGNGGSGGNGNNANGRKVFECDVCQMKFSNGANMRRHKMRHTGVKPFECRVCLKRFFRKDHLAEHTTTHTKTLPYHCPVCHRGFQRQIAMRAHFQNEHVGQHDVVKTCPLCTYRASTMKSLRIHFFNRHGIDLDNPGASGSASSLLLALESQATHVAAAAAAAGLVPNMNAVAAAAAASSNNNNNNNNNNHKLNSNNGNSNNGGNISSQQSDSGESLRSPENGSPPIHFLTPHVEISTLNENGSGNSGGGGGVGPSDLFNVAEDMSNNIPNVRTALLSVLRDFALQGGSANRSVNTCVPDSGQDGHCNGSSSSSTTGTDLTIKEQQPCLITIKPASLGDATQDQPLDCNMKSALSSSNGIGSNSSTASAIALLNGSKSLQHAHSHQLHHHENHITPSISLIPIKQEPMSEEPPEQQGQHEHGNGSGNGDNSDNEYATPMHNRSMIKVSPLKSLLREDYKRRFSAKEYQRSTRHAAAVAAVASLEHNNGNSNGGGMLPSNIVLPLPMTSSMPLSLTVAPSAHSPAISSAAAAAGSSSSSICNGTITSTAGHQADGGESTTLTLSRKQILTCHFCSIEFPDETLYFLHKGCHCESNPWKCNICGEQCNNVYEFNAHLLSKSHQ